LGVDGSPADPGVAFEAMMTIRTSAKPKMALLTILSYDSLSIPVKRFYERRNLDWKNIRERRGGWMERLTLSDTED
jgi:hypothetical protein